MKKNLAKATIIQGYLLEEFRKFWEFRPDETDYFPIDQIMDKVKAKYGNKVDNYLLKGSLNYLLQQEFIEVKELDNKNLICRLTSKGREKIEQVKIQTMTRKIALVGAVNGTIALVLTIIKIVIEYLPHTGP
jgi:hypothetical protein